jgi:hypothetical protein
MMTVADAFGPYRNVPGSQPGLAVIFDQDRAARQHDQKLIFAKVPVPLARPGARLQHDVPRAKLGQPAHLAHLSLPAPGDRLVERRWISRGVGRLDLFQIDFGHDPLRCTVERARSSFQSA